MTHTMTDLEVFTDAYIAAALWASPDESDGNGGNSIDNNYGLDDLAPKALKAMQDDCRKFLEECSEWIEADPNNGFDQAGHDFWLTRNGHGCGFWEPDDWTQPWADKLDKASVAFGECYLYVENDTIYC